MDEQKMPRRPRRSSTEEQPKNESLVYGKNPVTELLKSGSGVDTVLLAEGMAPDFVYEDVFKALHCSCCPR